MKKAPELVDGVHSYAKRYEARMIRLKDYFKKHNGKSLERFVDFMHAKGYSKPRILKYLYMLPRIHGFFRDVNGLDDDFKWEDTTKDQMIKYIGFIESDSRWSPETKMDYRTIVKRFFRWLEGDDVEYPPKVAFIMSNMKAKDKRRVCPDELLTEEEMKKLIESTTHPRDTALISLLCESGCRIGEALSMSIGDVKFDEYGCLATFEGKTGQRTVRLVFSTPHLANLVENHPLKSKGSPLFLNYGTRNNNKPLNYAGTRKMMKKVYDLAGIEKKNNPHLLRHSRASILASKSVLGEFQMNQFFGWVQGGRMAGTYMHLNCKSTESSLLQHYGVQVEEDVGKSELEPKKCPRCQVVNPVSNSYCSRCGGILDTETALKMREDRNEADNIMDSLLQDPEVRSLLMQKMEGLKG